MSGGDKKRLKDSERAPSYGETVQRLTDLCLFLVGELKLKRDQHQEVVDLVQQYSRRGVRDDNEDG